jgi:hypothetical protein
MTNNPNILVDVRPCKPFMILLATTDGGHSHTNVCRSCGLLPLPLLDGTSYHQTCFVNPYALETFISPQAIVNSSAGTFNKWQLEGFSEGRTGILLMYSPSGLLKMSIWLSQQDGLYYSSTDTFTINTNPCLHSSPFMGSAFTVPPPDVHLIDNNDDGNDNDSTCSNIPNIHQPPTAPDKINDKQPHPRREPLCPCKPVRQPTPQQPMMLSRSRVTVRPTNLARQLESKLWAACLSHFGEHQLTSMATHANGLPNSFKFYPFQYINWKEQAQVRKRAARCKSQKVNNASAHFHMDFGFIRASSVDYSQPNITSDRIIESYDGYNSYLLIVDDKSAMSSVFPTKSKSPPIELVHLFLGTF